MTKSEQPRPVYGPDPASPEVLPLMELTRALPRCDPAAPEVLPLMEEVEMNQEMTESFHLLNNRADLTDQQ